MPPPDSGWTVPAGVHWPLPTEKHGKWLGTKGDSDFVVNDMSLAMFGLTASDRTVPYRKGEPYFDKWAVEWYEITTLTGAKGGSGDDKLISLAVAARHCNGGKIQRSDGDKYLDNHSPPLVGHHAYKCYVAIIPAKLNALSHRGTAAQLRTGVKCQDL